MIADNFTLHAQRRAQQRGIPPLVVELLERFGSCVRCCGADRLIFDRAALKRLRKHLGGDRGLCVIERWLSIYAVIGDDGRLVTVSHQHHRVWRD